MLALFHCFDDLPGGGLFGGQLCLLRFAGGVEFAGKFEDAAEQRLDLPRIQAGNVGIERRRGVGQAAVVGRFVIEQRGRQEEGVADGFDARFVEVAYFLAQRRQRGVGREQHIGVEILRLERGRVFGQAVGVGRIGQAAGEFAGEALLEFPEHGDAQDVEQGVEERQLQQRPHAQPVPDEGNGLCQRPPYG